MACIFDQALRSPWDPSLIGICMTPIVELLVIMYKSLTDLAMGQFVKGICFSCVSEQCQDGF